MAGRYGQFAGAMSQQSVRYGAAGIVGGGAGAVLSDVLSLRFDLPNTRNFFLNEAPRRAGSVAGQVAQTYARIPSVEIGGAIKSGTVRSGPIERSVFGAVVNHGRQAWDGATAGAGRYAGHAAEQSAQGIFGRFWDWVTGGSRGRAGDAAAGSDRDPRSRGELSEAHARAATPASRASTPASRASDTGYNLDVALGIRPEDPSRPVTDMYKFKA